MKPWIAESNFMQWTKSSQDNSPTQKADWRRDPEVGHHPEKEGERWWRGCGSKKVQNHSGPESGEISGHIMSYLTLFGLCFTQAATYRMNNLWTFQFRGGLNLPEARTRRGNVGGQLGSLSSGERRERSKELWVFIFPIKWGVIWSYQEFTNYLLDRLRILITCR